MSVGNESAFPVVHETIRGGEKMVDAHLGMSYRQWLIGQIACAVASAQCQAYELDATDTLDGDRVSEHSIMIADAIIARLDAEQERKA